MDGADLMQALMDTLSEHDGSIGRMRDDGRRLAEAERDYRIALRVEIVRLRDEGMPATITPDLARGEPRVAALRFDRDLAKAEWEADRSNCERLKNQSWIIERQIDRELR